MNFEPFLQLLEEQKELLAPINTKINQLKGFKQEAKEELKTIDSISRKAFSIKGEIAQLEEAIPKAEAERRNLIEKNAKQMKARIKSIRDELISDLEQELSEKYKADVIAAVDTLINLDKGYKADEGVFEAKMTEDILQFKEYDDHKFPDISREAHEFTSYGHHYVFNDEIQRLLIG